jgi:hypothetical protein
LSASRSDFQVLSVALFEKLPLDQEPERHHCP